MINTNKKAYKNKLLLSLLCLMISLSCLAGLALTAHAAQKNGLVKEKGKYYYYKRGKKAVNTWKKVRQKKGTFKYYFGKKGAACQAKTAFDKSYNVKVFKIGNKKYGFDANAHLVAKGIYVDTGSRIWVFKSGGVYDAARTKALRSAFKPSVQGEPRSSELYQKVIDTFGEPLEVKQNTSCNGWYFVDFDQPNPFYDVHIRYKYFEAELVFNEDTNEYALTNFFAVPVK